MQQTKTSMPTNNPYGLPAAVYTALLRFSTQAEEAVGIKTLAINSRPRGHGCTLKLSGAQAVYELIIEPGAMLLGRIRNGERTRLVEAGTGSEVQWGRVLASLRQSEGKVLA
jgi:hypothetical protein